MDSWDSSPASTAAPLTLPVPEPLSVKIFEVCLQYEVFESVWLLHTETKYIPKWKPQEEWVTSPNMFILDVTF